MSGPRSLEGELSTLGHSLTFNFKVKEEILIKGEESRQQLIPGPEPLVSPTGDFNPS